MVTYTSAHPVPPVRRQSSLVRDRLHTLADMMIIGREGPAGHGKILVWIVATDLDGGQWNVRRCARRPVRNLCSAGRTSVTSPDFTRVVLLRCRGHGRRVYEHSNNVEDTGRRTGDHVVAGSRSNRRRPTRPPSGQACARSSPSDVPHRERNAIRSSPAHRAQLRCRRRIRRGYDSLRGSCAARRRFAGGISHPRGAQSRRWIRSLVSDVVLAAVESPPVR
ncbi:hypothetical protein GON09_005657 [Rhodococcus sp. B50]|nr:hypothetical protein [Rhodococcus sp. B50]